VRKYLSVIPLVLLLLLTASLSSVGGRSSDIESLRDTDAAWAAAAASNVVDRMISFYDPDAAFINTNGSIIKGEENLRKFWTNLFSLPEFSLTWTLEGVEVSPDGTLGCTYGPWKQSYIGRDGQIRTSRGSYLAVWKRQADGTWKVLVDKP
jgi:ketosteroid isomerase-like protein